MGHELGLPADVEVFQKLKALRPGVQLLHQLTQQLQLAKLQQQCQTISRIDVQAYLDMNARKQQYLEVQAAFDSVPQASTFAVHALTHDLARSQAFYEDLQAFLQHNTHTSHALHKAQQIYYDLQKIPYSNRHLLIQFMAFYMDLRVALLLQHHQ